MDFIVADTYEDMSRKAADVIAGCLATKPDCVLGLATGSTPIGLYADLVQDCAEGRISFADATTFNLDEYRGLDPQHDQSYRYFMQQNLFDHVDVDVARTHVPDGANPDAEAACAAYEEAIAQAGGIDLQLLGLGHNGHIGFNEPCDHFPVITHEVQLTEMTREANKRFFDSLDDVPTAAITMGVGTVMAARKTLLIATGADKADILYKVFFGTVTPEVPGSILQFHPDVTVICDEAAAAMLPL